MVCPSQSLSAEFRFDKCLKEFNSLQDDKRVMGERLRYIHEASRLLILDRYAGGKLSLLLYVQTLFKEDEVRRAMEIAGCMSRPDFSAFILHFNAANVALSQDGDEQAMFVSVVEIVNGPDGLIPSVMRLYDVNHQPEKMGTGHVYFSLRKPSLQLFNGFSYRKLGSIINQTGSEFFDGSKPRVIEGAFEVVNRISDHQTDVIERTLVGKVMLDYFASGLRVNLNNSGIGCVKKFDAPFDVSDVLIGPLNLEFGISE